VIGIAFAALLIVAGEWSYTDVLQAAATNNDMRLAERGLWCACLLAGTIVGGASVGQLKPTWPPLRTQIDCFVGGTLMGLGSLLVPGGNDGLILLGVPMLSTSAWVATATMFATMAAALTIYLRRAGVPA
jgi:toxin CptA